MKRPNRKMRRKMGMGKKKGEGQIRPVSGKPNKPQIKRTPPPLTEEGILDKIRWLEYQRIQISKYPYPNAIQRVVAITGAIQIYYKKLENLKNPPKLKEKKIKK